MRKIGSVLYDVPPLVVNPVVALIFGTHEAIVLQQLHYWLEHKKRKKDIDKMAATIILQGYLDSL